MKVVSSHEDLALPDGGVTDSILQIVLKISELLKNSIDSLKLPEFLKTVLKKIKVCLINKQIKIPNTQARPRRPVRPPGIGVKNMGNMRIRLRRYKIKRFISQPKNVEVKQNRIVVRRMVVRRYAIFPGTRRRHYY